MYNDQLKFAYKEEEEGNAFIIQPKEPVKIHRIEKDVKKLKELYEIGYKDAENSYDRLKDFLGK